MRQLGGEREVPSPACVPILLQKPRAFSLLPNVPWDGKSKSFLHRKILLYATVKKVCSRQGVECVRNHPKEGAFCPARARKIRRDAGPTKTAALIAPALVGWIDLCGSGGAAYKHTGEVLWP